MLKRTNKIRPKISVIIPSYNKEKFIGKTLKSIFGQNYGNLEVIVQDGASTDGTLKIIKSFSKKYPNILKFYSKKDDGQLDAIQKGISRSTGEIITFINADDVYCGEVFLEIANAYAKHPHALWFAGKGTVIDGDDKEITKWVTLYKNILLKINSYNLLLSNNYLIQPSVFFTRDSYNKYGPFTGTSDFITEYEFWLRLGRIQMPVCVDKTLTHFRIEPSTKTKRLFNDLLNEDEKIVKRYTKNPIVLTLHKLNNVGRKIVGRFL